MKYILLACLFLLPTIVQAQTDNPACYCVTTARQYVPETPRLDAKDFILLPEKSRTVPTKGGLILLKYPNTWHIAVIRDFGINGFITSEGNYKPCEITHRVIAYNDPHIKAFFTF